MASTPNLPLMSAVLTSVKLSKSSEVGRVGLVPGMGVRGPGAGVTREGGGGDGLHLIG